MLKRNLDALATSSRVRSRKCGATRRPTSLLSRSPPSSPSGRARRAWKPRCGMRVERTPVDVMLGIAAIGCCCSRAREPAAERVQVHPPPHRGHAQRLPIRPASRDRGRGSLRRPAVRQCRNDVQGVRQGNGDRSGLGLGLAIARRSVEADGGTLSVRDVPGTGCVFTISLARHELEPGI